jgi:hypothetical protein
MRALRFDGFTTSAYWEARVERPQTWEEYTELPLIRTLDLATQQMIWRLLGHDCKDREGL